MANRARYEGLVRAAKAGVPIVFGTDAGLPALREAISADLAAAHGLDYAGNEVVVTAGAQEGIVLAMLGLCVPGDEVLITSPRFTTYDTAVRLCGGVPVPVPTYERDDFAMDVGEIERRITPRTRLFVLVSPNNPTGAVTPPAAIRASPIWPSGTTCSSPPTRSFGSRKRRPAGSGSTMSTFGLSRADLRRFRKRAQIVFQDPYASLNPRERVRAMLGHALALHGIGSRADRVDRSVALMEPVGLSAEYLDRYPHEFSGGQPLGWLMEVAPASSLYSQPRHPYTQALLSAVPVPGRRRTRVALTGDVPSPIHPPSGCVCRTRCPRAEAVCAERAPELSAVEPGHASACHVTS